MKIMYFKLSFEKVGARHLAELNLRCVRTSRIYMIKPNFLAFVVSDLSAFIRMCGQKITRLGYLP